ncbi:MAG: hypothetical protein NVSMB55_00400 [Mycobacteriales bacterium]
MIVVPRRRSYGLLVFAAALLAVAALSDQAGRLLALPAAVASVGLAVRDLRGGTVLVADRSGLDVEQGLRRIRVPWVEVERMRVLRDRRAELLELDLGRTLALLSRQRLGRLPQEVLADLLAVRATAAAGGPAGGERGTH